MSKIGIFGGAFSPVHQGHIALAKAAFKELKLNEMLIIPTSESPHKTGSIDFSHRMEMCNIAFGGIKGFSVSDIEKKLGGKSYTINTVRALKEIYPKNTEFYLIIGGDMLFYFEHWYRYEALLKECHVVAAARENDSYADLYEYANELGRVKVLNLPVIEVSSSDIRDRIKNGRDTDGLVTPEVLEYINSRGLYRD